MTKDKSIFIKNIYYMLSYAFEALKQANYEDIATEKFDNIYNLFAAILSKGIGQQLKQGVYREYTSRTEKMTVMRGKIDFSGTIKNKLARERALTNEYDELSENNLFNQILKTTVFLLLRQGEVEQRYKDILKKEMLFFAHVDTVNLGDIRWTALSFQRNNQTYRMLIGLCRLVAQGMLLTTETGRHKLASFICDQGMSRLYEKFLLEYYKKEFPELHVYAARIRWALDDDNDAMLPAMQSDITLEQGEKVLIIDAKYYTHTTQSQYNRHTFHSNNLYQIFTYVKNRNAAFGKAPHEVSGMLLYAQTEEAIQPNGRYRMSGNKISVRTLDLNQEFAAVAAQLNNIAAEHFAVAPR